ncbi:hypothetical protein CJF12_00140 [Chryseobacterium piperi]|uniref:tyrosine-type recombinase/integrase n=1 Tax=Chryseobacterium piperi TaxID=558152 RepID=UPI000BAA97C2|nr:tyrosine-type recombinase/integrase [Chryseobacterium piperi]ASW72854.1 hypothetical protein CJF12_00140 [Chryseobacterium piperi]
MENFKRYLELRNYQKRNVIKILSMVQEYRNYIERGNLPTEYINYLKQRKHKTQPHKNLNVSTINNHLFALKIYKNYQKEILQKETNLIICRSFKTDLATIEVLSPEEVQILFESTINTRDKAVLASLYYLGLRIGEAAELLFEDVDLKDGKVLVRKSKTGYQREVPIHSKATEIFEEYLKIREHKGDCFLQGQKGNLTPSGIEFIIEKLAKKSKIKRESIHIYYDTVLLLIY